MPALSKFSSKASLPAPSLIDRLARWILAIPAIRTIFAVGILGSMVVRMAIANLVQRVLGTAPKRANLIMSEDRKRAAEFRLLKDETAGKHRYATIDGVKLHFVEGGSKTAPLIIFLHGFPQNWTIWRNVLPPLARKYRVVALDMRGYGGSDIPEGGRGAYSLTKLTGDVKELAEMLQVEAGNDKDAKFTLCGHDWGAVVSWEFAARYSRVLSHLVIVNVPPPNAFDRNMTFRQLSKSWYIVWFQIPGAADKALTENDAAGLGNMLRDIRNVKEEDIDVFRYGMFREEGRMTAAINYYRANMAGSTDAFTKIPTLDVPTLVVWGENDIALDLTTALWGIEDYVPNVSVEILKGVGHFVPDEEPANLAETIQKFLQ
ncbi:alpha/beta-hydrolase [Gonapodya prolifera JEL478]|uniref:Alpha/beta-hydrolase n=1 Tax=Gonapodya prolifera (strain JEL478) TaxID=1344416 RepID=A0A139A5J4_GONPJ|nr:alpha/beta-hydrolase [Gonapodya prolifera JEL478]|eukprot:KXS12011.1 alpha/beta-hydrolase [Gonapodya prolifera JEL478]